MGKAAGTWDCYNTCELQPSTEEPPLTEDDVQALVEFPDGPLYSKSQSIGMNFDDARAYCQKYNGDLVSIHN